MKTGRKQRHFIASDGTPVVGLSHQPDGRWRIIGTSTRFSATDEKSAIEKFKRLTSTGPTIAQQRMLERPNPLTASPQQMFDWVADQIRQRPQYAAKMMGIEQIGYLETLKPAKPLITPKEIRELWETHYNCSIEEMKKVRKAWDYFIDQTEIKSISEIDPDLVVAFRDTLWESGWNGKTQSHIIHGIRRILTFAAGRARSVDELAKIQGYLKRELLHASETTVKAAPKAVELADWQKLLAVAEGQDKAMILMMLNAALYVKEAMALQWKDIQNDCLITRRAKTGKCIRAAVLWPETLAALKAIDHKRDEIFVSYAGAALNDCGAHRRFIKLAERAGVEVTGSQLRDGAYTAAVGANIQPNLVNIFVGHKSGLDDRYVMANPKIVLPCTEAVYAIYMKKCQTP